MSAGTFNAHPNIESTIAPAFALLPAVSNDILALSSKRPSRLTSPFAISGSTVCNSLHDGVLMYTTTCGLAHTFFSYLIPVMVNRPESTFTIMILRANFATWLKCMLSVNDTSNKGSGWGKPSTSRERMLLIIPEALPSPVESTRTSYGRPPLLGSIEPCPSPHEQSITAITATHAAKNFIGCRRPPSWPYSTNHMPHKCLARGWPL